MKATHSSEYFEKYENVLFKKYQKECNFEHELNNAIPDFSAISDVESREKAKEVVTKLEARRIAERATEKLIKKMREIQDIKSGHASLGFTTKNQEINFFHDLVEGFEFSCWMLAKFKKKYSLT